jgi:hypothetical protein
MYRKKYVQIVVTNGKKHYYFTKELQIVNYIDIQLDYVAVIRNYVQNVLVNDTILSGIIKK